MSNSIGPCPTELDTLDSNIGAALALAAAALAVAATCVFP